MSEPELAPQTDPVRAAVRFPLHLEVTLHWGEGAVTAMTDDVFSSGILFHADTVPPVNASVEFSLTMPAAIMGQTHDVVLQCVGRVVRHQQTGGKYMAAAVIDEYSLKG